MAEYSLSSFLPFIGKAVKDEYGRTIGNVISFTATPIGFIESVVVGFGGSEFEVYPVTSLKSSDSTLVLISSTRTRASTLGEQLRQLWKKLSVLDDLRQRNTITSEAYSHYHSQIEDAISKFQSEADGILIELQNRTASIAKKLDILRASLLDVELARGAGEFENSGYETAISSLNGLIKASTTEQEDLENLTTDLKSLRQEPAKPEPEKNSTTPEQEAPKTESPKVLEVRLVGESSVA